MATEAQKLAAEQRLSTKRLILREFRPDDFGALRQIDGDPEVLRYRSRPAISAAMTLDFLVQAQWAARQESRTYYPFAVELAEGGRLVGQCGLTLIEPDYCQAFLWYSMNRRYWGQGYASEAAAAVLRFGFEQLGLTRIQAGCHPENAASIRLLEKIGLRPVEEPPPCGYASWPLCSSRRFAVTAGEWSAMRQTLFHHDHR